MRRIWVAGLLVAVTMARAEEVSFPVAYDGTYLITFRAEASSSGRTKLHRKLRAHVEEAGRQSEVDLVRPRQAPPSGQEDSFCDGYRREPLVAACEPRRKPKLHEKGCAPAHGEVDEVTASFVRDVVEKARRCTQVETRGQAASFNGKLSPFWAQELIGADLVRTDWPVALPERRVGFFTFEQINLGKLDPRTISPELRGCDKEDSSPLCGEYGAYQKYQGNRPHDPAYHGTAVAQLVADPSAGVGVQAELKVFSPNGGIGPSTVDAAIERKVDLLCASQGLTGEATSQLLRRFEESGGLVVRSAGNDFPAEVEKAAEYDPITVASLSPTGLTSYFSSPGERVDIAAPSDHSILSGTGTTFGTFGGTSGAQPLVCGAIANLRALLPGITVKEVRRILQATASPTLNLREQPRLNGAGMLNAYAAMKAAERLASEWPANRARLFGGEALFSFEREAREFATEAQRNLRSPDPCRAAEAFQKLRRAFLLEPSNPHWRKLLAREYLRLGFDQNAKFLDSMSGLSDAALLKLARDLDPELRNNGLRALFGKGRAAEAVFAKILEGRAGIPTQTNRELDSYVLAARGAVAQGASPIKVHEQLRILYERPDNSADFDQSLFQRGVVDLKMPGSFFLKKCVTKAKEEIWPPCLNVALLSAPGSSEANEHHWRAFLSHLGGRLGLIRSQRSDYLTRIVKGGELGRSFLDRERASGAYDQIIIGEINAALDSKP